MLSTSVALGSKWRASTLASHSQAVKQVILTMHERLSEPLSLEDMADIAMLSPYHFNRVFRRITGIPPSQFLYALRFQAAKRLLLTTQLSVTDVCFEVGYNSLGTFSARFNQLVGLPPRHLRSQATEMAETCLKSLCKQGKKREDGVAGRSSLSGQISTMDDFVGFIFVGLFSTSIPQSRPIGCTFLTEPGAYRIAPVRDGRYYLFAIGLDRSEDPLTYLLLNETRLRVGAGHGTLLVRNGQVSGRTDLKLRSMQLTDPPVLTALPLLLVEHLTSIHMATFQ